MEGPSIFKRPLDSSTPSDGERAEFQLRLFEVPCGFHDELPMEPLKPAFPWLPYQKIEPEDQCMRLSKAARSNVVFGRETKSQK